MNRQLSYILITSGLMASVFAPAHSQTPAAGQYYATPSWDQRLPPSTRFVVLSNWNNEAVLDRETGLVWQRTPSVPQASTGVQRSPAILSCWNVSTGGRKGWRLPRADELLTLGEPDALGGSPLPAGHPFAGVIGGTFWAMDYVPSASAKLGTYVSFTAGKPDSIFGPIPASAIANTVGTNATLNVWCVRGGDGSPSF